MGFNRDKDESALNRIVSQIDGGLCREELAPPKISPHELMYRRYNHMRETQVHQFSEPQREELSEGYRPLRKRVPLEERSSGNFFDSEKTGDPLAAPLAGAQPLRKRLPESLHEMRTRVHVEDVEDPAAAIQEEARLEEAALARRRQRQATERISEDVSLNESFEDRKKLRKKPLDLDMPIANREGMRVSEAAPPRKTLQPQPAKQSVEPSSDFREARVERPEEDLSGYLRNLGLKTNKKPVEESGELHIPTREEAFKEEQEIRNRLFTEGVKPEGQEQTPKPSRRRVVSSQQPVATPAPVKESEESPPVREAIEDTFKKLNKTLAENSPQGIRLFEDILHDYVSLAYVNHKGIKIIKEEDI